MSEFRFFLFSLKQYFEYFIALKRIDVNDAKKFGFDEFEGTKTVLEKWVGPIYDM